MEEEDSFIRKDYRILDSNQIITALQNTESCLSCIYVKWMVKPFIFGAFKWMLRFVPVMSISMSISVTHNSVILDCH